MLVFAGIEVKSDCLEASNLRRPFLARMPRFNTLTL